MLKSQLIAMATERSLIWQAFYWIVICLGVFFILSSYFPGVSGGVVSPQPEITPPGSVLQIEAGSEFTLTCQASSTQSEGDPSNATIHLKWCAPYSDPLCRGTTGRPWDEHTDRDASNPNPLLLSLTETAAEDRAGQYSCVAWMINVSDSSIPAPKSADVTVELTELSAGSTTKLPPGPMPTSKPSPQPVSPSSSQNATTVMPHEKSGPSGGVIAAIIIIVLIAIMAIVLSFWCFRCRKGQCCKGHRVRARQSAKLDCFTSDAGMGGFGMTPVQAEMEPFITRHRCDVFIHHHGTDLTLAELMRSKLLDQESHLHVTLWSEIAAGGAAGSGRRESRPSTKRLALSLVHSSHVVLLVSWKYLQHEAQRFRLALTRVPRKIDSVRNKVVIVRRVEEDRVPADLRADIAQCLEYNVDTDSKFFWPRFSRAVIPARDDMLYWRT